MLCSSDICYARQALLPDRSRRAPGLLQQSNGMIHSLALKWRAQLHNQNQLIGRSMERQDEGVFFQTERFRHCRNTSQYATAT